MSGYATNQDLAGFFVVVSRNVAHEGFDIGGYIDRHDAVSIVSAAHNSVIRKEYSASEYVADRGKGS